MVSDTVEVVSVFEVIEPCVKLGTTGTASTVLTFARTNAPTVRTSIFFITHQSIVSSLTNCPVATVPLPPAVSVIAPEVKIVPARSPAEPEAVEVTSL